MTAEAIDLLTWYRHFSSYINVDQVKHEVPKMWNLKRTETLQWLAIKQILK